MIATLAAVLLAVSHLAPASSLPAGARLGTLMIPAIGLRTPVDQCGLDCFTQPWPAELSHGPGHYPGTRLPWQQGLAVLSGHRTTYTHPFGEINRLHAHDRIIWRRHGRWYVYRVTSMRIVRPRQFHKLGLRPVRTSHGWTLVPRSNRGHRLLLVACHPPHYAYERIAVFARRVRR